MKLKYCVIYVFTVTFDILMHPWWIKVLLLYFTYHKLCNNSAHCTEGKHCLVHPFSGNQTRVCSTLLATETTLFWSSRKWKTEPDHLSCVFCISIWIQFSLCSWKTDENGLIDDLQATLWRAWDEETSCRTERQGLSSLTLYFDGPL